MDRININLLPPELKEIKNKQKKRALIVKVTIGLLILMVIFTGGLLVAVVLQNIRISRANDQLALSEKEVNTYKEQEAIAQVLRSRVDGINSLITKEFPQAQAFDLIITLTPDQVRIFSFSINKTNKVAIQGETRDTNSLDTFFNNLIDPKYNEGKISKVVVDSLSKDKSNRIRFDLSLTMSGIGGATQPTLAPVK